MSTATSSQPTRWGRGALGSAAVALLLATACTSPDETVDPPGVGGADRELSFEVGADQVYATFTTPHDGPGEESPGVLIISGSGPTDRDGNSDMRPEADTNLNLSRVLTELGVASLRYDKLGSGETGFGSYDPDEPIDPQVFEAQVVAAYEELLAQPEVDPERTVVLGHSEGALYALRLHELVPDASPAVVLAAPPGTRYMDLIDRQLTEQVRTMEAAGGIEEHESVSLLSDARAARAAIREGHALPNDLDAALASVYAPQNTDFLTAMDALDPVELAEDLPRQTPVLVLWGEEDGQVLREDVDRLMDGFVAAERVDLPKTDHGFRENEDTSGAAPRLDADRPFASDVTPVLADFLDTAW